MQKTALTASYYNHLIKNSEGYILFNARTLATATFTQEDIEQIKRVLNNPNEVNVDNDLKQSLIYGGYLVANGYNEKAEISQRLWQGRKNKDSCSLTIAPTMGCNFNCGYCFESEEVRSNYAAMSLPVQDKLLAHLRAHFEKNQTKTWEVTWFGGEPLLALDVIKRLSKGFLKICQELNIKYQAGIITNGYRLDAVTAKCLKECQIKIAQVTLDGPEFIHDSRRVLKGGKGSFKKITKNIYAASEYIHIKLRVNVDKQNKNYLDQLLQEILTTGSKNNISIYSAPLTEDPQIKNEHKVSLGGKIFSEVDLKFALDSERLGFSSIKMPALIANACGADHIYSLMVGPEGEIYQCWDDFGNKDLVVGSIFHEDKANQNYVKQYMEFDPTVHPKCNSCKVMPLCMGGCPKQRLLHGEPQCGVYKFNLAERVTAFIEKNNPEKKPVEVKLNDTLYFEKLDNYEKFFHKAFPNNYVYVLTPKKYSVKSYIEQIKQDTLSLNKADFELYQFCRKHVNNNEFEALVKWQDAIKGDANLLGVYAACDTIQYIEKSLINKSFACYLKQKCPDIIKQFKEIPERVLSLMRLNLYVVPENVKEFLVKILDLISRSQSFFNLVERVEIAKEGIKNPENNAYPTLIIYFLSNNITDETLSDFLREIAKLVPNNSNATTNDQFAYVWLPCVTVTQGYKLYKRYLHALGIIDELYEKSSNYAFCHNDSERLISMLNLSK